MTLLDYVHRKNEILYDLVGITLIPEDQIDEEWLLARDSMSLDSDEDHLACPYCIVFNMHNYNTKCIGCPMYEAGNSCLEYDGNGTYKQIMNKLEEDYGYNNIVEVDEIQELVLEYLEEEN